MDGNKLLRTRLSERLEDLQKQFPACSWLKEMAEINGTRKVKREPRTPLETGNGTYQI